MHCFLAVLVLLFFSGFLRESTATHGSLLSQQSRGHEAETFYSENETLLSEGEECLWTDDCDPKLCCVDFGNGTLSCQPRPTEVGASCSVTMLLTPFGDEGTYRNFCPCSTGLTCTATNMKAGNSQSIGTSPSLTSASNEVPQHPITDSDEMKPLVGTCARVNKTETPVSQ
uniref:Putative secreted protein n=1 Tax=Amblyomma parvum TaxID=251391 RepID=A0A023G2T7_AMBPA